MKVQNDKKSTHKTTISPKIHLQLEIKYFLIFFSGEYVVSVILIFYVDTKTMKCYQDDILAIIWEYLHVLLLIFTVRKLIFSSSYFYSIFFRYFSYFVFLNLCCYYIRHINRLSRALKVGTFAPPRRVNLESRA